MVWYNCNVTVNSGDSGILYTGDTVTGSVTLEFKEVKKIKYVELKVIGVSKARWSRLMPTVPYIKIYAEKKTVLDTRVNIFNEINGKKIQKGISDFQFHFDLPSGLPSTFNSSIAKVSYFIRIKCKATCNRRKIKIIPLIVMNSLDLNHIEENKVPMMFELGKKCFSMFFKTYRSFSPKQSLPFYIDICNEKRVRIRKLVVTLVQKLEYSVMSGYANEEKKICKVEQSSIPNATKEYFRMFMDVPQTAPSSVNVINPMIDISYVLRVEVFFKFHLTLYEDIPVIISTVPVLHNVTTEILNK